MEFCGPAQVFSLPMLMYKNRPEVTLRFITQTFKPHGEMNLGIAVLFQKNRSCIQSALADEEPADGAGQEDEAVQDEPQGEDK